MTVRSTGPTASVRPPDLPRRTRGAVRGTPDSRRWSGVLTGLAELPLLLLAALVMAFLLKTLLVQAFYIPSGSMIPTLQINDRVLVEKVTYRLRRPERGEVLVFQRPGVEPPVTTSPREIARNFFEGLGLVPPDGEIDLIKRVVGLPGETVAIDSGRVLIDGEPLDEPYAMPETRSFPATSVPPGHLFLMGDNRMDSDDSRFSLGPVPVGNVVGRAFVIVWPPSRVTARLDADYPSVGERPGGAHIDRPSRTRLSSHSGAVAQPRRAAAPAASPRANPRPRRRRLLTHEPH